MLFVEGEELCCVVCVGAIVERTAAVVITGDKANAVRFSVVRFVLPYIKGASVSKISSIKQDIVKFVDGMKTGCREPTQYCTL